MFIISRAVIPRYIKRTLGPDGPVLLHMAFSIYTAAVVSLFVEAVLYGIFVLLFVLSLFVLVKMRRRPSGINKPMLVISLSMFAFGTTHLVVDLHRAMEAFVDNPDPLQYLEKYSSISYVLKMTSYSAQTLVGDGFVLYRLYLVWTGDKRICAPIFFCFVASFGVAVSVLRGFTRASAETTVSISNMIIAFIGLTLFTNFISTSLIAVRIWWMHQQISALVQEKKYIPAMMIVIESGSIYSVCLIILLVLYVSGSYAGYILLDAVTQIIGIVFSFIIVRVGLGLSNDPGKTNTKVLFATYKAGSPGAVINSLTVGGPALDISSADRPQSSPSDVMYKDLESSVARQ